MRPLNRPFVTVCASMIEVSPMLSDLARDADMVSLRRKPLRPPRPTRARGSQASTDRGSHAAAEPMAISLRSTQRKTLMKHHLLASAAAGLLLFAANVAFAQARVTADQYAPAVNSVLTVDQSTVLNGEIRTLQSGVNSSINIVQDRGSSATANLNQAQGLNGSALDVVQIDGHALAHVVQSGAGGAGAVQVRQHFGGGEFDRNEAWLNQDRAEAGTLARVEQVGDTLTARLEQSVLASGSVGEILQVGGSNFAMAVQVGGFSDVVIQQGALGQNVFGNNAQVTATGPDAVVGVYQTGDAAIAKVQQTGSGLTTLVHQRDESEADIKQMGSYNLIDVTQSGTSGYAIIEQGGTGNQMTLTQSQDGAYASLGQFGSNNVMTIVQ